MLKSLGGMGIALQDDNPGDSRDKKLGRHQISGYISKKACTD